mmetsp:Transcript_36684/g.93767  ORF Transcript_36684/g.93767 Transcript_36684/m.93767 type:complete len:201 (-) Transcript_36684:854-1456(-)
MCLVERKASLLRLRGQLHCRSQADRLESRDDHPSHVDLPPLESMPGAELKGVVVVVPALAEREHANPPVVPAQVASVVVLASPYMSSAVHKPGDVVHPDGPQGAAPNHGRKASKGIEGRKGGNNVPDIGLLNKPVEPLLLHVVSVGPVRHAGLHSLVIQQPSSMTPPEAFKGRVRVQRRVAVQVVVPVAADPLDGVALHG